MQRKADHPIQSLLLHRRSLRAMSGEEIPEQELLSMFEAARWAPSSYNGQPWRFLYARKNTPHFAHFVAILNEFNQSWAKNAGVLGVIISRTKFEHNEKPSVTHAFDAGAAWENFALEGCGRGFVVHGMEGFDYEKARRDLKIPPLYEVMCMFAVGKPGSLESLPPDLQKRESPTPRKKIEEFTMEGHFRD